MHPKNQQCLLGFISVVILIFNFISSSLSAYVDELYASCAPLSTTCGPSLEIEYPFWDINRPNYCGHPGFELECQGNSLTLQIQDQIYNVLDISNKSNTFTISKSQFSQGPCPTTESELTNTTLDFSLFTFTSTSENATFFYDCQRKPDLIASFSFTCPQSGYVPSSSSVFTSSLNIIAINEKSKADFRNICAIEINIPVFKTQMSDLANGITNINDVVSKGFELKWMIDESQCKSCIGSEGRCGFNHTSSQPICLCRDGAYDTTCEQSNALPGRAGAIISSGSTDADEESSNPKTNPTGVVVGVGLGAAFLSLFIFFCRRSYRKT